jgi:hypothetical protein
LDCCDRSRSIESKFACASGLQMKDSDVMDDKNSIEEGEETGAEINKLRYTRY